MESSASQNVVAISLILVLVVVAAVFVMRRVSKTLKAHAAKAAEREESFLANLPDLTERMVDLPATSAAHPDPPPAPASAPEEVLVRHAEPLDAFFVGPVQPKARPQRVPVPSPEAVAAGPSGTGAHASTAFAAAVRDLAGALRQAATDVEDAAASPGSEQARAARVVAAVTAAVGGLPLGEVVETPAST